MAGVERRKKVKFKTIEIKSSEIKPVEKSYRYVLGEYNGGETMYFIGINPSRATLKDGDLKNDLLENNIQTSINGKVEDDPTIELIRSIANENESSWVMLNIYPERASKVECLPNCHDISVHMQNIDRIKNVVMNNSLIVAMWGDSIEKRNYFINCLQDIVNELKDKNIKWKYIEKTDKDNPIHPLYYKHKGKKGLEELKKHSSVLKDFSVEEYLNKKVTQPRIKKLSDS